MGARDASLHPSLATTGPGGVAHLSQPIESPTMPSAEPSSLATTLAADEDPTDLDFEGDDVLGIEIRGRRFTACAFRDCDFEGSRFVDCSFVGCVFRGCRFREAAFVGCRFGSEDERPVKWHFCDLSQGRFEDCNLSLGEIDKCTTFETTFDGCSCLGLRFDAEVHRHIGRRKMAGGVRFEKCRLQFAVFKPADYEDCVFESSDLRDVDFSRGNYTRASFRGSVLHNTDFAGATLDEADISGATFDAFPLADLFSHQGLVVSPDQQAILLAGLGIRVAPR